jgi:hypothetical protein
MGNILGNALETFPGGEIIFFPAPPVGSQRQSYGPFRRAMNTKLPATLIAADNGQALHVDDIQKPVSCESFVSASRWLGVFISSVGVSAASGAF